MRFWTKKNKFFPKFSDSLKFRVGGSQRKGQLPLPSLFQDPIGLQDSAVAVASVISTSHDTDWKWRHNRVSGRTQWQRTTDKTRLGTERTCAL